jgi:hypothetical protein
VIPEEAEASGAANCKTVTEHEQEERILNCLQEEQYTQNEVILDCNLNFFLY